MIRGKKSKIPKSTSKIELEMETKLHNRFDIEIVDSVTGNVKQKAYAENVICNALWSRVLAPATYFNYIHYGTGTGTPASTDTSLFTFLSYKTPLTADDSWKSFPVEGYCYLTRKVILNPEDNIGETITEVGIGYGTAASNLVTHAMLKDMNGNQISIVKTSTDLINIYATIYLHWDSSALRTKGIYLYSRTGAFLSYLLGMYNVVSEYRLPTYAQCNYGATASNSSSTMLYKNVTNVFSVAAKTITCTVDRIAASEYNYNGLFCVNFFTYQIYSRLYGPVLCLFAEGKEWYTGRAVTGEAVGTGDGVTADFKTIFPIPENAVIYVDGIQDTNVVVDSTIVTTDIGRYFCGLDAASTSDNLIFNFAWTILNGTQQLTNSDICIYYNPFYSTGVRTMTIAYVSAIDVSDDLANWVSVAIISNNISNTNVINIPTQYQNSKYWKFTTAGNNARISEVRTPTSFTGYNIHFTTPPASGAVITADYTTKAIAKDANHVFDVSVVITLGEYTS